MDQYAALAGEIVSRCAILASHTEEPGHLTRTFLCDAMQSVHADVRRWMEHAGMRVRVDPAGNLRGVYPASAADARSLILGSHLDTVPHAGAYDGPLGVLLAIGLVELLKRRPLPFSIEVIGFSEEEGVRFGMPFIGSRALVGDLDAAALARQDAHGASVSDAIRNFGLDPARIAESEASDDAFGYVEFHIEQGPVLESLGLSLGIVQTIVGQSRLELKFEGHANHAGTTPMHLRRDALAGAAEWILAVEREAAAVPDLVATVGRIGASPGAGNVISGSVVTSLDVRHAEDSVRRAAVLRLLQHADEISCRRRLTASSEVLLDQAAVPMDAALTDALARAVRDCGLPVHLMNSGAGHDAGIVARRMPVAMMFLRSPGGISHHPDEAVLEEDVAAALAAGSRFIDGWGRTRG